MRDYIKSSLRVGFKVEIHSKLLHHSISIPTCGNKFIFNGLKDVCFAKNNNNIDNQITLITPLIKQISKHLQSF